MHRFAALLVPLLALASAGCNMSKVKYEGSFKLDPGQPSRTLEVDAPKKDQTVSIEVTSSETINVEVVLDKDRGKSKPLKFRTDTRSFNDTVNIPANEKFAIVISLRGPKPADVVVKANSVN